MCPCVNGCLCACKDPGMSFLTTKDCGYREILLIWFVAVQMRHRGESLEKKQKQFSSSLDVSDSAGNVWHVLDNSGIIGAYYKS